MSMKKPAVLCVSPRLIVFQFGRIGCACRNGDCSWPAMMTPSQLAIGASVDQTAWGSADLIRAEYREMPGLRLTKRQIQRMWGLDPDSCDTLVNMLVAEKFLKRVADAYVLGIGSR